MCWHKDTLIVRHTHNTTNTPSPPCGHRAVLTFPCRRSWTVCRGQRSTQSCKGSGRADWSYCLLFTGSAEENGENINGLKSRKERSEGMEWKFRPQRICLDLTKLLFCIAKVLAARVKPADSSLWSPALQSLTYSIYVLSPLTAIFTRNEALCALRTTRERKTLRSAAWNSPSSIFWTVCALIQCWWAGGDDTCFLHCSLFMVKSGLSWGSTLAGRSILPLNMQQVSICKTLEAKRGGEPETLISPLLVLFWDGI